MRNNYDDSIFFFLAIGSNEKLAGFSMMSTTKNKSFPFFAVGVGSWL